MAIHHLRKWSLKYKVREATTKLWVWVFFVQLSFFGWWWDPPLPWQKTLKSEWLSTYSLQVDFGFFKIRIRLVNRKKRVFFDFLMKLDEGFPTSLDLDSWCFAVGMMDGVTCFVTCLPKNVCVQNPRQFVVVSCPSFFFVFRVFITWRNQPLGRRYLHTWSGLSLGDTRVR